MANKIILKKSSVTAKIPTTSDLDYGELAINYADGKLYFKKSDNTIDEFISASATVGVNSVDGNTGTVTSAQLLTAIKKEDGSGSGLDADLLDGQDSGYYAAASSLGNYLLLTGGSLTGALNLPSNGLIAGTNQLVLNSGNVGVGTATPSELLSVSTLTNTSKLAAQIVSNSGSAQTYVLRLNRVRDDAYGTSPDNANNSGHTILRLDTHTNLNYAHGQEFITGYKGASKVFLIRHDGYLETSSAKVNSISVVNAYAQDATSGTGHLAWLSTATDKLLGLRNQNLVASYGVNLCELVSSTGTFGNYITRFKSGTTGNLIFLDNNIGNTAIGTASPTAKLDVNGSIRARTSFIKSEYGTFALSNSGNGNGRLQTYYGAYSAPWSNHDVVSLSVGYDAYTNTFDGTGQGASVIQLAGTDGASFIRFLTGSNATLAERIRITAAGDIGIGTSSPTTKLDVNGSIKHTGLTLTEGSNIDQVTTLTKSLTLTTDWQDTGIKSTDLTTGTYIVQLYANDSGSGGTNINEYYSGTMSWYSGDTNSSLELPTDEIVLHRAGGSGDGALYLRTFRTATANPDNLKLQIYSNTPNASAANYVFKFRRVI